MKTLFVVRHAKSSWENPLQSDHDRPLNARGLRDAPEMGKRLRKMGFLFDRLCSSSATRAFSTAEFFAEELGIPAEQIVEIPELYHAPASEFWAQARALPEDVSSAIFFSHNPGITEFANETEVLTIDNMPTCAVLGISFDVETWNKIDVENALLLHFDFPKSS